MDIVDKVALSRGLTSAKIIHTRVYMTSSTKWPCRDQRYVTRTRTLPSTIELQTPTTGLTTRRHLLRVRDRRSCHQRLTRAGLTAIIAPVPIALSVSIIA
jgi:hypothetical protein